MSRVYLLQKILRSTSMALTLGKTRQVRLPGSESFTTLIYVGVENTGPLVKAYSSGTNKKITDVEYWWPTYARSGWVHASGLHLSYWNGGLMTRGYAMKNEMTWEKFMAWWAPKQLAIELDYWTMDPNEPAGVAVARCLP